MMHSYSEDPAWADIEPIPQDDTGHPLAAIAYSDEYSEAMGYLRAVMAKNEYSDRVLGLTEHIIGLNPAHYTVWLYRAQTLQALEKPLRDEIAWLNPTALKHLKNYQIWNHRQTIIDQLGSPEGEADFIDSMLKADSKNYHVWSYRQWLVQRFDLYNDGAELAWVNKMINEDVRNNSAWNHRYFLVFGNKDKGNGPESVIVQREIEYSKEAIRKAPQNPSPWNYLRGVLSAARLPIASVQDFVHEFANLDRPDDVRSSHALDCLAAIYAEEKKTEDAVKSLDLLATKYDRIRARYWEYRKGALKAEEARA